MLTRRVSDATKAGFRQTPLRFHSLHKYTYLSLSNENFYFEKCNCFDVQLLLNQTTHYTAI